jgi:diacylglycerol kinase family enzyme
MKHVFVFDPKAFYNQQWKMDNILDDIGQFFRTQENLSFSIQYSRYRRNAMGIIQDEIEKSNPGEIIRIYAVGGEEILFDCMNGVAHYPNTQLAIVPYGETNNFIKIFGENKVETFRDIPTLVHSDVISTDAIRWGINYALNSCYIGMNSAISKKLKDLKTKLNKGSYILFSKLTSFVNNFLTAFDKQLAARQYRIIIDDVDYSGHYSLIHVANSPYFAGRKTGAADATPDDGLLDIALIKAALPMLVLSSIRRYSKGKRPRNCTIVQGKKISITSKDQMWIQLDNEYIQDTEISLNIIPQAIPLVVVPGLSYPMASISAL